MTPGVPASAIALSMSAVAVTQTGQPGPDTISTVGGSAWRMPYLKIATVCPPQNSMKRILRFDFRRMSAIKPVAKSLLRNSVINLKFYLTGSVIDF